MYMLEHTQSGFLGGYNKIALVGGTNVPDQTWAMGIVPTWATPATGSATDPKASIMRLHESFAFDLKGTNWSGMLSASMGKISGDVANYDFWNIGVRPQYNFSANKSIAVELSHTEGSNATAGGDRPTLDKLTIAPQLTLSGGFWARPVLRAFVTYAQWNDAARANGVANGVFGTANNGTQVGFQAEAWW
jgi:maltoporin